MHAPTCTFLVCLGLASTVVAQGAAPRKAGGSDTPSKAQLSEIRTVVHELERATSKLSDLLTQYGSLAEQRPPGQGQEVEKWNRAVDRLMKRMDKARTAVVETLTQLDKLPTAKLPTSLGKDVVEAQNEAKAERANAERLLAKHKPKPARASKSKRKPEKKDTEPPPLGDLDDL